jgi:sugar/nucleoside kinase (ribokinase family)
MGTEVFANALSLHAGGGAFITAAHLAALGRPAHLAATIPAGCLGDLAMEQIATSGVDASLCRSAPGDSDPQITVAITNGTDRSFVTRRTGPALPDPDHLAIAGLGFGHLHIGELATLIEHPDLLNFARRNGLTISLDCSWDDAVMASAGELIAQVDVFLPNRAEADQLAALGIGPAAAPLTVVKCGARGAQAICDGKIIDSPACPATPVDTTGAGDAFNSGFLHRWLDGASLADCLAAGNTCGAQAVATVGGAPSPLAQTHAAVAG